jgi:hypothetical protein
MMRRLSRTDIEHIQLTAPGACEKDFQDLVHLIKAGKILAAFTASERDKIWENLCSSTTDCLVPSLYAFFENLKYLKGPADCMNRLIRPRRGQTIQSALWNAFTDPGLPSGKCLIQGSKNTFFSAYADSNTRFGLSYRQVWLNAIRDYRDMPKNVCPKLAKPKNGEANETVLYEFASLAKRLGIETEEIHDLVQHDPDKQIARRLLRTARDPSQYRYKDFDKCIGRLVEIIHEAEPLNDGDLDDIDVDDDDDDDNLRRKEDLQQKRAPNRCGIPNDTDQVQDKRMIFVPRLHHSMDTRQAELTSFFVQRSLYFFFFGKNAGVDFDKDLEPVPGGDFNTTTMDCERLRIDTTLRSGESEIGQSPHAQLDAARQELESLEASLQVKKTENQDQEARLKDLEMSIPQKEETLKSLEAAIDDRKRALDSQTVDFQHIWGENKFTKQEQEWQAKLAQLAREEQLKRNMIEELEAAERNERIKLQDLENEKNRLIVQQTHETVRSAPESSVPAESSTTNEPSQSDTVRISFMQRRWAVLQEVVVDPTDSKKEVQRAGIKLLRKQMGLFDKEMRALSVYNCFQRVTKTGSNIIFVIPGWEVERTGNIEPLIEHDDQARQKRPLLNQIQD